MTCQFLAHGHTDIRTYGHFHYCKTNFPVKAAEEDKGIS